MASVGILSYPGAQAAAIHGLTDLLETANRLARTAADGATGAPRTTRRKRAANVPTLHVETVDGTRGAPSDRRALTALIVPPCLGSVPAVSRLGALASWIAARHREGTVVCSVCVGGFVLAETGLLDGRPATTHWALRETFAARFPAVALDVDRLVIDDGDIITAGGVMAWIDLGLRLIERLLGPAVMLRTARYFLVDPGGREQRFYRSFAPPLGHGDAAILRVQHWLHARGRERVTLPAMARRAGLGERTFLRRFFRATALTPTAYVQELRIAHAREQLELGGLTISEIAWRVGYADPGAFRKIFTRIVGLSPGAYRERFSRTPPAR